MTRAPKRRAIASPRRSRLAVGDQTLAADEERALRWRTYPRPLLDKSDHTSGT
jgi:hypothetical protein